LNSPFAASVTVSSRSKSTRPRRATLGPAERRRFAQPSGLALFAPQRRTRPDLAARAGIAVRFGALLHVCLSEDAAAPCAAASGRFSGDIADEPALFAALARALASEGNDES